MTDSLFSWSSIMTLSGAAMITFLIVLYTSRVVDSWWKWGTDLYAALWAFIILMIATIASGGDYRDWRVYCLAFFNSFLVAASAGKLRDKSITEVEKKRQKNEEIQNTSQVAGNVNGGGKARKENEEIDSGA